MAGKLTETSIKWQLCYDMSARTWWMVSGKSELILSSKPCNSFYCSYLVEAELMMDVQLMNPAAALMGVCFQGASLSPQRIFKPCT